MNFIIRRRKLGRTSCREVARLSTTGLTVVRNWRESVPDMREARSADGSNRSEGFVFRWGCTSELPSFVKVVNKAEAIHRASDKRESRLAWQTADVSVPKTWGVLFNGEVQNGLPATLAGPFVARPTNHAQGRNLVVGAWAACVQAVREWRGGYISELINKVAEYRVFVVQGRCVWVAKKTPGNPDDVAWNVARGGRFDNVRFDDWPLRAVKEAIKAFDISGLDFGGVDVMLDANGKPYILEINSAPSQTSPYRQLCTAKAFDYIVRNNSKAKIPLADRPGGWKKFAHPCLSEEVWV